jgi:hypothetical protein
LTVSNVIKKASSIDKKVLFSTLWIFATLNYIYADVFTSFFNPDSLKESATMTQGSVLGFAVLMETAMVMVILSRVLKYGPNRWLNIIVGIIQTAAVGWSLSGVTPKPYYIFYAVIEMACTLLIIWLALRWRKQEA